MNKLASVNTPYGGLGTQLDANASIEAWAHSAGFDFEIEAQPTLFVNPTNGALTEVPNRTVLTRNDDGRPLSVVSDQYKVVQPMQILEFYRDLVENAGFALNTAGVLNHGRKVWAIADIGQGMTLRGNDAVHGQLLLATSCDGTFATVAKFVTLRMICNNQLDMLVNKGMGDNAIKILHSQHFDPTMIKEDLGLMAGDSFSEFQRLSEELSKYKLNTVDIENYLRSVFAPKDELESADQVIELKPSAEKVFELFSGQGLGSELESSAGTAWGMLNAVTEFVDHHRDSHTADTRLDSAWFGPGRTIKRRAWEAATELIA